MFQFLGYNFLSDGDALNNAPSLVNNITNTQLQNGIFNHFNVTKKTDLPFTTTIPIEWDYDTILNADFNGDLDAGNIGFVLSKITSIKIKRRKKPSSQVFTGNFDWITLKEIPINSLEDLTFTYNDILNTQYTEYEYALVPMLNDVEGNYIINSVFSQFNGVFICDSEYVYKMFANVQYGTNERHQQIGTFEPLGRKYPVVVANGLLSYESGSVSATVINEDYIETGELKPREIVERKERIKDFLTNRKPKVLKDLILGHFYSDIECELH